MSSDPKNSQFNLMWIVRSVLLIAIPVACFIQLWIVAGPVPIIIVAVLGAAWATGMRSGTTNGPLENWEKKPTRTQTIFVYSAFSAIFSVPGLAIACKFGVLSGVSSTYFLLFVMALTFRCEECWYGPIVDPRQNPIKQPGHSEST